MWHSLLASLPHFSLSNTLPNMKSFNFKTWYQRCICTRIYSFSKVWVSCWPLFIIRIGNSLVE